MHSQKWLCNVAQEPKIIHLAPLM